MVLMLTVVPRTTVLLKQNPFCKSSIRQGEIERVRRENLLRNNLGGSNLVSDRLPQETSIEMLAKNVPH